MEVTITKIPARSRCRRLSRCNSECAEDERLERRKRPEAGVLAHVQSRRVTVQQGGRETLCQSPPRAPLQPCALLFLQVPTTVSSAPWHFSWLRRRSLPERLFPRLCGQQDMATRRCVDSVWACHHRIAAAATTPTPYRCRPHHQLLRPQSFLSCPRPVLLCPPSSHILFITSSSVTTTTAAATVQQAVIPSTTTPPTAITHRTREQRPAISPLLCRTRTPRRSLAVI